MDKCTKELLKFIMKNIGTKDIIFSKKSLSNDFPKYSDQDIKLALKYCQDNDLIKCVKIIDSFVITEITDEAIDYLNV